MDVLEGRTAKLWSLNGEAHSRLVSFAERPLIRRLLASVVSQGPSSRSGATAFRCLLAMLLLLQEIERQATHHGHILDRVIFTYPTLAFRKRHIEHLMHLILNPQVSTYGVGPALGISGQARD